MPKQSYHQVSLGAQIYNGLKLEAFKQNRSVANLTEFILLKAGIQTISEQEYNARLQENRGS